MVQERAHPIHESRPLNRVAGRRASRVELQRHLKQAPLSFLAGALENPAFSANEAVLLLRNHRATPAMLKRIAGAAGWTGTRAVRKALVRHPQVTPALAAALLPALYWKDLAETCSVPGVPAPVRHAAESLLRLRVRELTLGERVALARLASRGLIPELAADHEAPVLTALLSNPLLLEAEAKALAARPGPRTFLADFAGHPRWERNATVMTVLAGNAATPISVALGLVARLDRRFRHRLSRNDKVPRIVRVAAERLAAAPSDLRSTPRPRAESRGHRS